MEIKNCNEISDVIIIGAGLSGLTAAIQILEKEHTMQIKILEANSTIGGRVGHTRLGEIGGKWLSANQFHIYSLLQQLQIPLRQRRTMSPLCAKRCWDIDMGILSPFVKFELSRYIYELDIRVQFFKPGHFNVNKHAQTMYQHISNRLFFNKSRSFMENFVLLTSGVSSRDISYVQFMSNCYTCGGLKPLMDIYVFWPSTLLELPSSKLLNVFAERLKSAEILLRRKVNEVHQFKDYVEVIDSENDVHKGHVLIVAIPWDNMQDIIFSPPKPTELLDTSSKSTIKTHHKMTSFIASYDDGHWRHNGFSGNLFFNEPYLFLGNEYNPNSYMGLIIHEANLEPMIKPIALRKLADSFGEKMLLPTSYTQRSYEMSSSANIPLTTPWKRVVWSSSSAAATCYRNCLSGAVQSGLRAAVNALLILRPQTIVWQDIADIHHCDNMLFCDVSWFELWRSTWNLYNVTWYSVFAYTIATVLRQFHAKYNTLS